MIVFGVLVGFLAAFPGGHVGQFGCFGRVIGCLLAVLLCCCYQRGEGVGFKFEVYVGDPKAGCGGEGQVVIVASAKANVGAFVESYRCKFLRQLALLLCQPCISVVGGTVVQYAQRDLVTGQVLLQQAFEKCIQPFFGVVGDDREGDDGR